MATVIEPSDVTPRGISTFKRVLAGIFDPNRRTEPTRLCPTLAQTADKIDLEPPLVVRLADLRRARPELSRPNAVP